jgi:putative transposase
VGWNAIKKQFRARIDTEFPFVREVTRCAPEAAIADLRRAISAYYPAKKNPKLRFPRPRKRRKRIGGFGIADDKFRVDGHTVWLPRIGAVNMTEPLRFDGRIVRGRVTGRGGHWYLTVVVEVEAEKPAPESPSVGIDFGLSRFATLSDGKKVETQARLRTSEAKLKRLRGTVHDRDLNAAINIEMERIALLAGSGYVGGTPVEPSASTAGFGRSQAGL